MTGRLWRLLLVLPLLAGGAAPAGQPDSMGPPRVKPLAERTVGVKPWELHSISPQGASRSGGLDLREYAFSPDGKLLATEDAGGWQLELWDVGTGKSLSRFGKTGSPVALGFSPDGRRLATVSGGIFASEK